MNKYAGIIVILTFLLIQIQATRTCADLNISTNSTLISIRIAELLSNKLLVEAKIDNVMPENFSMVFNPERLSFNTHGSALLISYDARIPEDALIKLVDIEEKSIANLDGELLKCIQLLIVFATGLIILILEILFSKIRKGNILKTIEEGNTHFHDSIIDEESLLLLSSKNPEAYRRAIDMIVKGELKVKKRRFGKLFSRIKKFVNLRR